MHASSPSSDVPENATRQNQPIRRRRLPAHLHQPLILARWSPSNARALGAEVAQTRASNCKIGLDNLIRLQAFARIRIKGDSGEERVLSPAEKQEKIDDARKIIQDNC